jgi:hypothetical protein
MKRPRLQQRLPVLRPRDEREGFTDKQLEGRVGHPPERRSMDPT